MLVPINQVGSRWVQPFDRSKFPEGFTMEPAKLVDSREGRLTLIDVLPTSDYEVFGVSVPKPEGASIEDGPVAPPSCR